MNTRTLAAFVIGLASAGAVSAQTVTLRVNIPFSFSANGESLPAGHYTVYPGASAGTMMIRGADHKVGAITLVIPMTMRSSRQDTARLVFNGYGDQYFLSQIWVAGDHGGQLPLTRPERELMAQQKPPSQTVVAALR